MSKSLTNSTLAAPKHFTASSIVTFINSCQTIFEIPNKQEKGFILDLTKVEKASMLGVLTLYKVIESP